jgi:class 3 adenylate cyclase
MLDSRPIAVPSEPGARPAGDTAAAETPALAGLRPRAWNRLGTRVAAGFVTVTVLGVGLVGLLIYNRQKAVLQETLATLLLNIARTGALLVEPPLHAEVERTLSRDTEAYRRLRSELARIQDANQIATPIYTLTGFDEERRLAHFMVTSRGPGAPGEPYPLVPALLEPLRRAFREGVATHTGVYRNQSGTWITAFAPARNADGRVFAVLDVDYQVDVYLQRLADLRHLVVGTSLLASAVALAAGLFLARRVTGPIAALTRGVARVAAGDVSEPLRVRSRDEVGLLTRGFNEMLEGLRQRDFIRDTFGRYVSPEVVRTLLESPEGLRLGGEKREITVLMSDLRGYTRFVEEGDPALVVEMLNRYLGRMTDIIVEHGGTINEFMGDAIVAFFGAPLPTPDHAMRAAACAIAMQVALEELNGRHAAQALPRLEMGIGLNTGEAIVGNVGSEKRAKYTVVGTVINLAARVEACTVGGQVLLSPHTHARIRDHAEVGPPLPVEMKGLRDPLLLYELRALGGADGQRLPEPEGNAAGEVPVDLPVQMWLVEGKAIRPEAIEGRVVRLGLRQLVARLETPVAPLANVRLRLRYSALKQDSDEMYGKVVGVASEPEGPLARVAFTSVNAADRQILEALFRAHAAP